MPARQQLLNHGVLLLKEVQQRFVRYGGTGTSNNLRQETENAIVR